MRLVFFLLWHIASAYVRFAVSAGSVSMFVSLVCRDPVWMAGDIHRLEELRRFAESQAYASCMHPVIHWLPTMSRLKFGRSYWRLPFWVRFFKTSTWLLYDHMKLNQIDGIRGWWNIDFIMLLHIRWHCLFPFYSLVWPRQHACWDLRASWLQSTDLLQKAYYWYWWVTKSHASKVHL